MIVVSDTTPLITLMKIGHLDLLKKTFGEVQIPEAVYTELTSNPRFQTEIAQIQNCPFIHVQKIADKRSVNLLRRATGLDIGESEAIILSDNIHADLLLIDELKGRQVAEQMGIKIMGTIGFLIASFEEKNISETEIIESVEFLLMKLFKNKFSTITSILSIYCLSSQNSANLLFFLSSFYSFLPINSFVL